MRMVLVSTYPPRRCGLATFARDLRLALLDADRDWNIAVCAIDRDGLTYGPEVTTVMTQDDPHSYRRAARDMSAADMVLIQHEYGIFGGPDGAFVLHLADELRSLGVPYAVTLHTVLARPTRGQEATLAALCRDAARVTVFSRDGARLAAETGIADPSSVTVVPHGAPLTLRLSANPADLGPAVTRLLADLAGPAQVVATFGLIGPGKGIHDGIAALPRVLARLPDVRYVIAGATHPELLRRSGEAYRTQLAAQARRLGVSDRVHFLDTFLSEPELGALLARTDVYLTPYTSPDQICSGALTFALAAGLPVVSTAYRYAVEMLTPHQGAASGIIVPCGDVPGIAAAITDLLSDPQGQANARKAADALGASLTWPAVASRFAAVCTAAAASDPAALPHAAALNQVASSFDHVDRLTDEIGIIQFANGTQPDPDSGYCVDDMARLALVAVDLAATQPATDLRPRRWLAQAIRFLAVARADSGMHNLLTYQGSWRDQPHTGDHIGRTVWALGVATGSPDVGHDLRGRARDLLGDVLPLLSHEGTPRTLAYAILGLARCSPNPEFDESLHDLSARLARTRYDGPMWHWYEPTLTYDNAQLAHALLAAGARLTDERMVSRGLSTLDWYLTQVGLSGPGPAMLHLIGNRWRRADAPHPSTDEGDEQPLDAAAVILALTQAWRVTRDERYARLAARAFAWFHGVNRAVMPVYDPATGGCRDGLGAIRASDNEGAESTLAYHQARLALVRAGLTHHHGQLNGRRWPSGPEPEGVKVARTGPSRARGRATADRATQTASQPRALAWREGRELLARRAALSPDGSHGRSQR